MSQNKNIITDFKDLRKVIGEITKKTPAKTRYQQQAEKMGYKEAKQTPWEFMQDVVKKKSAMKYGSVTVDMFTASAIVNAYKKVNNANKKKIEKGTINQLISLSQKVMGLSSDKKWGEPLKGFPYNEVAKALQTEAFSKKPKSGAEVAKLMMKSDSMKGFASKVKKMKTVTAVQLDKMLPDYISGGDIGAMFEELSESKMGDLLIDIQQGATAKELSKYHNISIQTAKNFLSDYYGSKKTRTAPGLKKGVIKSTYEKKAGVKEDVQEGTWKLPKSSKEKSQLKDLMKKPIPLGKDGDSATDVIDTLIGDDSLLDDLHSAGKKNPNADARPIIKKAMKRLGIKEEVSREDKLKEEQEHAKQSPFKLKSQQYPRAIAIDTDGYGRRHATVEDIVAACDSFGMIIDKELQVEQIQKQLGKKGFISYKKTELQDVFESRETERLILALESTVEDQEPINYTQGEISYAQLHEHEIEFLKPDGTKSKGPILKMSGKTFNVKDKYTGKSFTYKYSKVIEEEEVKTFKELSEAKFSPALIKKAIAIANKKEFKQGNYSGAVRAIEKLKKGLADDPKVSNALRVANEDINEVSIGNAGIQKDFPNVWAQKDKRMNSILMALVNLHGFMDNLKSYKKNPKSFIDSLKKIGKNDASLKKAGLTKKNIGEGFDIDTIDEWVSKGGTRRRVKERDQRKYNKLKEWEDAAEAEGDKAAYQKFFKSALKKFGVSSPAELSGDKEKEFYNYVDKNWKADHEEVDVHKSYKMDGRRKNFKEKMRKLGYIKSQF